MIIDSVQISQFEKRYRGIMINSLAGIKQAFLIGTASSEGTTNLAIFNSLIHIGANPPLWGFICRPDTVKRYTLHNILETGHYTFNYVLKEDSLKAHQSSAKYDRAISEFDACGFTAEYLQNFPAPFIAEAPVKIGLVFEEKIDISINGTILIIGKLEFIDIDGALISEDGFIDLAAANTLQCSGLDAYYESNLIERLTYASTEKWPSKK